MKEQEDSADKKHIVTLWLIGWSYSLNLTYIGNAVFVSMDVSDIFLAVRQTRPVHVAS